MTKRTASVAVLALALAACSPAGSEDTTTTAPLTTEAAVETTAAPASSAEGVLLSYALEPGMSYEYEVEFDQHLEMTAEGDPSALEGEDLPGEASIDISGTTTFMHTVSEGPEEGTYEIHITGEFAEMTVSGIVDGEEITEDIPDIAEMEPVDVTVVVDEQGRVIQDGEAVGDPFGGAFGGMDSLTNAPGLDPGQFIGPPLSNQEVEVGDSWSEEIEIPAFGDEPIVTSIESTVTGTDQVDGAEVFVIETSVSSSPIELDLGEFFLGLFGAFIPEDASDEEVAQFEAMMEQLKFLISIRSADSSSTTWFDAEAGIARRFDQVGGADISMDLAIPDETTGELVAFKMDMSIAQDMRYHLLGSSPTA